jgi:hypothetical protein
VSQPRSFVVLGQHLGQLADHALGRAGLGGFGEQALGQASSLAVKPAALLKSRSMFQMRSPMRFRLSSVNSSPQAACSCGCHVGQAPGEGGEHAQAGRVERGGGVLEGLDQFGLAFGGQRVGLDRDAQHFGRHRVAAQVAGAAVAGGVGQADALDAARRRRPGTPGP